MKDKSLIEISPLERQHKNEFPPIVTTSADIEVNPVLVAGLCDVKKEEYLKTHSQCHNCDYWFKDTDFSSFTLGMVLCHNCDS
jgi:hypothetical protein